MSSLSQTPDGGRSRFLGMRDFLPENPQICLGEEKPGAGISLLGNAIYGLTMTLILNYRSSDFTGIFFFPDVNLPPPNSPSRGMLEMRNLIRRFVLELIFTRAGGLEQFCAPSAENGGCEERSQAAITCSALTRRRFRFGGEKPTPGCQNIAGNNLGKAPGERGEGAKGGGEGGGGKMLVGGGVRTLLALLG